MQEQGSKVSLTIGVCDDEQDVFDVVSHELKKCAEDLELDYCLLPLFSPDELITYCSKKSAELDLLIMDIRMPEISGIALSNMLNQMLPDCQIVYHTNYLEYATEVYETNHSYYILKPQLSERLPQVLDKVVRRNQDSKQVLILEQKTGRIVIRLKQLMYIERFGKVSFIHMEDGSVIKTGRKLQELLDQISMPGFVRCHNSYVVSFSWISIYRRTEFEMKDGLVIPISRGYAKDVQSAFARWGGSLL